MTENKSDDPVDETLEKRTGSKNDFNGKTEKHQAKAA